MERHIDEELRELKETLGGMGALVESMIDTAVSALEKGKPEQLEDVFNKEEQVNKLQIDIDNMCLKMLALRQPIASDLRMITSAMKINSDLERIGDQAVNIAQNTEIVLKNPANMKLVIIPQMAEIVKRMVKDSIDSFVNGDIEKAKEVLLRDEQVDELKEKVLTEFLKKMAQEPATMERNFDLILISRNLEKVADHTTNIAEDTFFLVSGEDIRHHSKDGAKQ